MQYKLFENNKCSNNVLETFLTNRGVKDFKTYTNLTENVLIHYSKLDNIFIALNCFLKHFNMRNKISILIDEDVDGFTSSAIMYSYIKQLDKDYPVEYILHKKAKSHGLNEYGELIDIPNETKLLIVPDAGTNDYNECKQITEQGIDIIILDHHEKEFDNPYAIVVNNQTSNSYDNKTLCGVGIVYKFLQAIDEELWVDFSNKFLDLVALGNISDMMDIRSFETKFLIDKGLSSICNNFFKSLIEAQNYTMKDKINIHNIQWYITPVINGMIRFGSYEEKDLLFRALTEQYEEFEYKKRATKTKPAETIIENIYDRVARLCLNAKNRQDNKRKKGVSEVNNLISQTITKQDKIVMADVTDILDNELTGVVAMKVAEEYNMPCILLRKRFDNKEKYGGSMRIPHNCPVYNFKDIINSCESFNNCIGHQGAAGVEIDVNKVHSGKQELNNMLKDICYDTTFIVDYILNEYEVDFALVNDLIKLEDYVGQGIPETLIAIEDIQLSKKDFEIIGKNSNTITFRLNDIKFIMFNANNQLLEWLSDEWSESGNVKFIIVGAPTINNFNGVKELQVNIKGMNVIKIEESENTCNNDNDDFDW